MARHVASVLLGCPPESRRHPEPRQAVVRPDSVDPGDDSRLDRVPVRDPDSFC
jgi:hypothetical protein